MLEETLQEVSPALGFPARWCKLPRVCFEPILLYISKSNLNTQAGDRGNG